MAQPTLEDFARDAHAWLSEHAEVRGDAAVRVGRRLRGRLRVPQPRDRAGGGAAGHQHGVARGSSTAAGGRSRGRSRRAAGAPVVLRAHVRARLEAGCVTARPHEAFAVTVHLVAPTIAAFGTPEQQAGLIPGLLRTEQLACQLFSEPGAGSDLAGLSTAPSATAIAGWSSAEGVERRRRAGMGELICRTDRELPKHAGLSAVMLVEHPASMCGPSGR